MELRPMGIGELIDHTIKLFRKAWKPLMLLGLISILPSFIVATLGNSFNITVQTEGTFVQNLLIQAIAQAEAGNPAAIISFFGGYLLLGILLLFLSPLWTGAFIAAAHQVVLGQEVTIGSALRMGAARYGALLGTGLLTWLLYLVAFPVLVIGGLVILSPITLIGGYLALNTFFAFRNQVIVIEQGAGGVPAMKRSWQLVSGRFWPILGTLFIFGLLMMVLGGILSALIGVPVSFLQLLVLKNVVGAVLLSLVQSLPALITAPLSALVPTLLYYDTRIRKEGLDLQMQMEQPL